MKILAYTTPQLAKSTLGLVFLGCLICGYHQQGLAGPSQLPQLNTQQERSADSGPLHPAYGVALERERGGATSPQSFTAHGLPCVAESTLVFAGSGLWSEHVDAARLDSMLYVAVVDGIEIFSLFDTTQPRRVGFVPTSNHTLLVAGAGHTLGAISYWSTDQQSFNQTALQLYSLDASASPVLKSETLLPHVAVSFSLYANRAYVVSYVPLDPQDPLAGFETHLDIYDVSDLAHPQHLSTFNLPGASALGGTGPVVHGETLIVPAGRLYVLDIHDPQQPSIVDSTETWRNAVSVAVSDSLFYVLELTGTLPANSAALSVYRFAGDSLQRLSWFEIYSSAWSVATIGTTCLVDANVSGTLVIDESDPTSPALISCFAPSGRSLHSFTIGHYAVTVNRTYSMPYPMFVPDEEFPDARCEQFDPGFPNSESGQWNNEGDIVVTDLADPYTPAEVGRYENPGYVRAVGTRAPFAVAISDDSSLYFLSSAAGALEPVFTLRLGGIPTAVAWQDSLLFVGEHNGLEIAAFDGSNAPHLIHRLPLPAAYFGKVTVQGSVVYFCSDSGLIVIDVSDPAQPTRIGKSTSITSAADIAMGSGVAYVCDLHQGVAVLDVSNPATPQEIARYSIGWSTHLAVRDSLLVVVRPGSGGSATLDVLDVRQPTQFHRFGTWPGFEVTDLAWVENDLAVAEMGGITVLDLTDPTSPRQRLCYSSPGYKRGVTTLGDTLYVASSIGVERVTEPTATDVVIEPETTLPKTFALGNPYPNPFNAEVEIPFALASRQHVTVEIFNVLGQIVATPFDGELPGGRYGVRWKGVSDHASNVASEVYVVKLSSGGQSVARKVVLLK